MCKWVALWEKVGYVRPQRAGVEGLLPLLHLGSVIQLGSSAVVPFRGTFDHTLDAKNRLTVPARYRAALAEGVVLAMPVDLKPCVGVWRPEQYETYTQRALAELPPLSSAPDRARALLLRQLPRRRAGRGRADDDPGVPRRARRHLPRRSSSSVSATGWSCGTGLAWGEHRSTLLSGVAEVTARVDDAA